MLRGLRLDLLVTGEMDLNAVGIGVAEEEKEYEEILQSQWEHIYDSITGMELDSKMVGIARGEELREIKKRKFYTKVPWDESLRVTGKKPIKVKFVDVNTKGMGKILTTGRD